MFGWSKKEKNEKKLNTARTKLANMTIKERGRKLSKLRRSYPRYSGIGMFDLADELFDMDLLFLYLLMDDTLAVEEADFIDNPVEEDLTEENLVDETPQEEEMVEAVVAHEEVVESVQESTPVDNTPSFDSDTEPVKSTPSYTPDPELTPSFDSDSDTKSSYGGGGSFDSGGGYDSGSSDCGGSDD